MKKYWKRLFGLLMTLCMMSTIFVPSALAGEAAAAGSAGEGTSVNGAANSGNANDLYYIPVSSGVRVGVNYLRVSPARYDETTGSFITYSDIYLYASYLADDRTKTLQVTPEQTANILAEFRTKNGEEANAWSLTVSYTVFTDGNGSYAKYFEFTPQGVCLDKTPIKVSLRKSTSAFTPDPITVRFRMANDISSLFSIGLSGGCYYYSVAAKKDLSTGAGAVVRFNSTVPNF